jgi:hypothetical protein
MNILHNLGSLLPVRVLIPLEGDATHGRVWTIQGDRYTMVFTTEQHFAEWAATGDGTDQKFLAMQFAAFAMALRDGIGVILNPLTDTEEHITPARLTAFRTDVNRINSTTRA